MDALLKWARKNYYLTATKYMLYKAEAEFAALRDFVRAVRQANDSEAMGIW